MKAIQVYYIQAWWPHVPWLIITRLWTGVAPNTHYMNLSGARENATKKHVHAVFILHNVEVTQCVTWLKYIFLVPFAARLKLTRFFSLVPFSRFVVVGIILKWFDSCRCLSSLLHPLLCLHYIWLLPVCIITATEVRRANCFSSHCQRAFNLLTLQCHLFLSRYGTVTMYASHCSIIEQIDCWYIHFKHIHFKQKITM